MTNLTTETIDQTSKDLDGRLDFSDVLPEISRIAQEIVDVLPSSMTANQFAAICNIILQYYFNLQNHGKSV